MDSLFKAAKFDDPGTLSQLICYPYSPTMHMAALSKELYDTVDWQLQSNPPLLSVACFYGSTRCVNVLLAMGADVNEPDDNGVCSLFISFLSTLLRFPETFLSSCR